MKNVCLKTVFLTLCLSLFSVAGFAQDLMLEDFESYADDAAIAVAIGNGGNVADRLLETTGLEAPGSTKALRATVTGTAWWGQAQVHFDATDFLAYDAIEFWGKIEGGAASGVSLKISDDIAPGGNNSNAVVDLTDTWTKYRVFIDSFAALPLNEGSGDNGDPAIMTNINRIQFQLDGAANIDGALLLDDIQLVTVPAVLDVVIEDFDAYTATEIGNMYLELGVTGASLETSDLPPDGSQALAVAFDNTNDGIGVAELTLASAKDLSGHQYITFWAKGSSASAGLEFSVVDTPQNGSSSVVNVKVTTEWAQYALGVSDFGINPDWGVAADWADVGLLLVKPTGDGPGTLLIDNIVGSSHAPRAADVMEDFELYDQVALDAVVVQAGTKSVALETVGLPQEGGDNALAINFDNTADGWGQAEIYLEKPYDLTQAVKITFWAKGSDEGNGLNFSVIDAAAEGAGCSVINGIAVTTEWAQYTLPIMNFVDADIQYWPRGVNWADVNRFQIQPTGAPGTLWVDNFVFVNLILADDYLLDDFESYASDATFGIGGGVSAAAIETVDLPPETTGTQAFTMTWDDVDSIGWGQGVLTIDPTADLSKHFAIKFKAKGIKTDPTETNTQGVVLQVFDTTNGASEINIPITDQWAEHEAVINDFIVAPYGPGDPLHHVNWAEVVRFQLQPNGPHGIVLMDDFVAVGPPTAPIVVDRTPPANLDTETLDLVSVTFNDPVTGVLAADLTVNGSPATDVATADSITYDFTGFAAPAVGPVTIVLAPGAITSLVTNDTFEGTTWACSIADKPDATADAVETPPVLDGTLTAGEWIGETYQILNPVSGDTAPADAADFSATFQVAIDDTYLYIAVNVTDELLASDPAVDHRWDNDSVEVFLDSDHDHTGNEAPGGQMATSWDGVLQGGNVDAASWEVATGISANGYVVEWRINRADVMLPGPGSTAGLNVQVQDCDGNLRESRLYWSSTASDDDPWDNAAAWGHLLIGGTEPPVSSIIEDFESYASDHAFGVGGGVSAAGIETVDLPDPSTNTQALTITWDDVDSIGWGQAVVDITPTADLSNRHAVQFSAKGSDADQGVLVQLFDNTGGASEINIPISDQWAEYTAVIADFITAPYGPSDPKIPVNWADVVRMQVQPQGPHGIILVDEFIAVDAPTVPMVVSTTPAANADIEALDLVSVTFSKAVTGVVAADLTVADSPATAVTTADDITYEFSGFAAPAPGAVAIALGSGLIVSVDTQEAFAGAAWDCVLVNKPLAVAESVATAPTLDGVLTPGEWVGEAYQITMPVAGDTAPVDAADLSATFYVMQDDTYLYVAADVNDDILAADPSTGSNWQNDTVELYIDSDHDHQGNGAPGGQLGLTWDNVLEGGNMNGDWWEGFSAVRAGGYAIEFRILRADIALPGPDSTVGFNVQVQDNDGSGRETRLYWSSTASDDDPWDNAAAWGHLLIEGGTVVVPSRVIEDFESYASDHAFGVGGGVSSATIETVDLPPATTGTQALTMTWDDTGGAGWGQAVVDIAPTVDLSSRYAVQFNAKGSTPTQGVVLQLFDTTGGASEINIPITDQWAEHVAVIADFITAPYGPSDPKIPVNWADVVRMQIQPNGPHGVILVDDFIAVQDAPDLTYTLDLTAGPNGSAAADPATGPYAAGSTVTLTATADAEYEFSAWTGDVTPEQAGVNPLDITMDANKAIAAVFTKIITGPTTRTLTVNVVGNGGVTTVPNQTEFAEGATVTLTAAPATGWQFDGWTGDVDPADVDKLQITLTMDANKTVTATFSEAPVPTYTLTVTAEEGGTATPAVPVTLDEGSTVSIEATPNAGYVFDGWTGDVVSDENPLEITMDADKTIVATFRALAGSGDYKVTYKKCDLDVTDGDIDGQKNFVITASSAKSSIKIQKLKKLPKNMTEKPGTTYLLGMREITDFFVDGDFGKAQTDANIEVFTVQGALKSVTTKNANIRDMYAGAFGTVKLTALRKDGAGEHATTMIFSGESATKAKITLTGVILEFMDIYQPAKYVKLSSKAWKDKTTKVKHVSLGGTGRVTDELKSDPEIFALFANGIDSLTAKGASIAPDYILSESDMKTISAKSKKLNKVDYTAFLGFADAAEIMIVDVMSNIGTIFGTNGVAGAFYAGGADSETGIANYSGAIKSIGAKKNVGQLVGEAHVSPTAKPIKFKSPQGDFQVFTTPPTVE